MTETETETEAEAATEQEPLEPAQVAKPLPDVTEASEVHRDYDLLAIGDLHGNFEIFEATLKSLGLIEPDVNAWDFSKLKWVGGNRKVIFLGDIIGDRTPEGLLILAAIRVLEKQAEEAGGKIVLLAGNHEDFVNSFLIGKKVAGVSKNDDLANIGSEKSAILQSIGPNVYFQGLGLIEFVDKYSDYVQRAEAKVGSKFKDLQHAAEYLGMNFDKPEAHDLRKEVLKNMRNSTEGRKTLEQLCSMKLLELDGDTLFLHTELTMDILAELNSNNGLQKMVDVINLPYQQGLRKLLLDEGEMPENFEFYGLVNIFLDTENRSAGKTFNEQISDNPLVLSNLHKNGLNRIVHGHTDISYTGISKTIGGIEIVNIDHSAGKGGVNMDCRSVFGITKEGVATVGKDLKLEPFTQDVVRDDPKKLDLIEKIFAEELKDLPTEGKFDLSKSPRNSLTALNSETESQLCQRVEARIAYIFADSSTEDLKVIVDYLIKLKEEANPKYIKLINLLSDHEREGRFLFSGEFGGIRVLNLSGIKSGNKGYLTAPTVMNAAKTSLDGEPKVLANLLKFQAKGKLSKLANILDTQQDVDVGVFRHTFRGIKAIFEWIDKL